MSTRKIATALGAAVLLLGMPTSYALAGNEDRPGKPEKVKQCSDGVDNDGEAGIDFDGGPNGGPADPDCGSPNDNSEAGEPAEEPGGETPDPAAQVQAIVDEVLAQLPAEEAPCEGADCPEEEPAPDPAAEVQKVADEVLAQLPAEEAPCEGADCPAEEPAPDPAAEVQKVADEVADQLPPLPTQEELDAAAAEAVATVTELLPVSPA